MLQLSFKTSKASDNSKTQFSGIKEEANISDLNAW